jgi:hypothetical protein
MLTAVALQVLVRTQNLSGSPIFGYYSLVQRRWRCCCHRSLTGQLYSDSRQSYTVEVQDYLSCHFDHWAGTGSTTGFTVDNGHSYVVTVANYGGESFSHWSDSVGTVYPWGGSHNVMVPSRNLHRGPVGWHRPRVIVIGPSFDYGVCRCRQ